jgi:hypothetical protein
LEPLHGSNFQHAKGAEREREGETGMDELKGSLADSPWQWFYTLVYHVNVYRI